MARASSTVDVKSTDVTKLVAQRRRHQEVIRRGAKIVRGANRRAGWPRKR
jgi:hypothetical protein